MDNIPQNRKVVEHNSLISSVAKMDRIPLQIFELAVSMIDTANPPLDNIIYLSKKEMFKLFDVSSQNKHTRFKQAVENMQKQAYFEIREVTEKGFKFESIVPIPFVRWTDYEDAVIVEFNHRIMPYLIDLKQNFTQYALSDVMNLNSKHSISIYKWLCMHYNQFEHYQYKANRTEKQLYEYANPTIQIKEMRELTDTSNKYKATKDLFRYMIDTTIQDINENTHFKVTYDKIKKGRSIDAIQFHVEKKFVADSTTYKEEQQDQAYIADKENKEQVKAKALMQVMQSKYTSMLLNKMVLSAVEMTDVDTMIAMQKYVYVYYDELAKKRDMKEVQKHIDYVRSHMNGYSKQNIAKYLNKAIKQYLTQVKIEDAQ
ncbi:RepB family plasmid replication initiator protein [Enterococcus italicus]